ncbi:MAG: sulfite exporter TauE/SafE family protein [Magnetococcales bacterium]|nr:sulfite exporter TauE/SafE family protein [Magnetococcales bacterium]MBF0437637.1 sulfite exporter TauE/SafE family protein [Magnetococcales bacterium]
MIEIDGFALAATAVLGLTMGLTACSAFCLPYFGSWVLGGDGTRSWNDAGWFFLGRVIAYALLGGMAAALGHVVLLSDSPSLGRLVLSGVSLLAGLFLLFFSSSPGTCHGAKFTHWPPLLLGMAVSLVPCPPLGALLVACALSGEIVMGLLHGMIFGLTTSLTPVLLASLLLGHAGRELRGMFPGLAPWLRRGAGVVLVILAARPFYPVS